jgi:hypothetical protein
MPFTGHIITPCEMCPIFFPSRINNVCSCSRRSGNLQSPFADDKVVHINEGVFLCV